jgi:hypothetical protein
MLMAQREMYEKQLEAAGEKMGLLMKNSSAADKERFRQARSEIEEFAQEMQNRGKYADRSCLFASWILGDPDVTSDELKNAARDYIEIDHLLIQSYKEEGE